MMRRFVSTVMQSTKQLAVIAALGLFVFAPALAVASPAGPSVSANDTGVNCNPTFLGIPAWYRGLATGDNCAIETPPGDNGLSILIWTIVLNVVEMMLVATVYIAVGFIIYGGFIWLTSGSNPQQVAKGRKAILNAVIGLVIAMGSIALTNLVFSNLVK